MAMRWRLWLRLVRIGPALLVRLPGHLIARRRGLPTGPGRHFLARVGQIFGLRVSSCGAPLTGDVLFVANHVSWLDILALGGATGAAFVSKEEVEAWPLVGWLAREGGTIFIRRQSRAAVRGQADALGQALARGRPVALFPEGTTGKGDALLPFRASLLAAVAEAPSALRVQPVAIDYGPAAREIAWTGNEGTGGNLKRVGSRAGRLPVTLRFLPPIDPAGLDRKAIAALARDAIGRALSDAGTIAYEPAP